MNVCAVFSYYGDGSGTYLIGIYQTEEKAQAAVGRAFANGDLNGNNVEFKIIEVDQDVSRDFGRIPQLEKR